MGSSLLLVALSVSSLAVVASLGTLLVLYVSLKGTSTEGRRHIIKEIANLISRTGRGRRNPTKVKSEEKDLDRRGEK